MKLLMMYCTEFGFQTNRKGLETAPELEIEDTVADVLVGFIHVEEQDEQNVSAVETKLVKNLKWAARKKRHGPRRPSLVYPPLR